jgi:hypothetical protein
MLSALEPPICTGRMIVCDRPATVQIAEFCVPLHCPALITMSVAPDIGVGHGSERIMAREDSHRTMDYLTGHAGGHQLTRLRTLR